MGLIRIIILLILFFFSCKPVLARCSGELYIWPWGKKIPTNSIFILEKGYRMINGKYINGEIKVTDSVSLINFSERYKAQLISIKDTVNLIEYKYYSNEFGFEQIIFKPERILLSSTQYSLNISNLKIGIAKIFSPDKYPTWITTKNTDVLTPKYKNHFIFKKQFIGSHEGDSEASYSKYSIKVKDNSECFLVAVLRDKNTKKFINEFVVLFDKKEILLSYNECYQSLSAKKYNGFEIEFELYDIALNKAVLSPNSRISTTIGAGK